MIVVTAVLSIIVFLAAFRVFGVARAAAGALTICRDSILVIHDKALDDLAREKKMQRASLQLGGAFIAILLRSALALGASFLPIWLISLTGKIRIEDVMLYLSRLDVIVIVTAAIIVLNLVLVWQKSLD